MGVAMLDYRDNGEVTFILQFPVWWGYAASMVPAVIGCGSMPGACSNPGPGHPKVSPAGRFAPTRTCGHACLGAARRD
jgi:hypothetical protein